MSVKSAAELQAVIGYKFKDPNTLAAALTHKSYVNEHKSAESYERYEFLGDCVLNFLVGEWLFFLHPNIDEGELSKLRAAHVSKWPLSRLVELYGLVDLLRVGAGVDKANFSVKRRSDIYEALIGAVYIDGGMDACKIFMENTFYNNVVPERDCRTELNEYAQKHGMTVNYSAPAQVSGGYETVAEVGGVKYTGRASKEHDSVIAAARAVIAGLKL
ncbi:MAG: ribonuclease III [Roseburia sp.]|nr:ribonuclease III [Roseburia sp.]